MAKTLTESALTTRAARAKLAPGAHFRGIDPEVHLGYRRGARGGVWFVRWRNGQGYRQSSLGVADDELREGTLDYGAAVIKARQTVEHARKEARAAADGPVVTVRAAVQAYVASRDKRESDRRKRPVHSDASWRLARHVIGRAERGSRPEIAPAALAGKALHSLREADLRAWQEELPDTLKATSRHRLINDLKAALNTAYAKHRRKLDPTLPGIIKQGLQAEDRVADDDVPLARDNQILTDAQIGALIRAAGEVDVDEGWDGDLYRLIVVLAGTGARFSQVIRMRVGDVQRRQRRLHVPLSRKGKGKSGSSIPVAVGSDVLDVLQPAMSGRRPEAVLLERWRDKQVGSGKAGIIWERDRRGPWQTASEIARPWKIIRKRAGLPDAIPYALRHSSIMRGIRAGLPIRLVAAIHDTSVAMIERHYSKWIVDGLDDLAERALVPLVPKASKVVTLTGRAR